MTWSCDYPYLCFMYGDIAPGWCTSSPFSLGGMVNSPSWSALRKYGCLEARPDQLCCVGASLRSSYLSPSSLFTSWVCLISSVISPSISSSTPDFFCSTPVFSCSNPVYCCYSLAGSSGTFGSSAGTPVSAFIRASYMSTSGFSCLYDRLFLISSALSSGFCLEGFLGHQLYSQYHRRCLLPHRDPLL